MFVRGHVRYKKQVRLKYVQICPQNLFMFPQSTILTAQKICPRTHDSALTTTLNVVNSWNELGVLIIHISYAHIWNTKKCLHAKYFSA